MRTSYGGYELLEERHCLLEAELYNRVLLCVRRAPGPLSLKLSRVLYTRMELDEETWWCLDHSLNDRPLFAWTGFERGERHALDEAVACRLLIFSPRAESVLFEVLRELPREMALRRARDPRSAGLGVTRFPSR